MSTGPGARVFSRHGIDLTRAFSDIAQAASALPPAVLDGELIAVTPGGELSFALLQTRSGKGPRPGAGFTVQLAAFDVLALADTDTRPLSYTERNRSLEELLAAGPPGICPLPVTRDLDEALAWIGQLATRAGGASGDSGTRSTRSSWASPRRPTPARPSWPSPTPPAGSARSASASR